MKVEKKNTEFDTTIFFKEKGKFLTFSFGGNGDLYWSIHLLSKDDSDYSFTITKDNYEVFSLFEKLFDDINIIKDRYELFNYSNYNELYDEKNKTITWYSDETAHIVANYLKIHRDDDKFKIDFFTQPYVDGYDRDFNSTGYISVRFRNSGSRYSPFNIAFMDMYNDMKEVDDVNDIGHQIHIEEYLYTLKKQKINRW